MKISITGKLYFGFISAIVLSLSIGLLTYLAMRKQQENGKWVRHTYQVMAQMDDVETMLINMETGRRGFRATNQKKFLEPYHNGLRRITPAVNQLKEMVADNPDQVNNVIVLEKRIDDILLFWRSLGDDASGYTREIITNIMDEEKAKMDLVRSDFARILALERRNLAERQAQNDSSLTFTSVVSIVGTALIQAIIIILIYFILSEFKNRRKAEAEVKENLAEVNKLNEESNNQNWLLSGVSDINDSLQGSDDIKTLSKNITDAIIRYLNIPAAALYIYDEDKQRLALQYSIALPADIQASYAIGEGLVGKAALEKHAIVIKNVPPGFWLVKSGTGEAKPAEVVLLPLWHVGILKGVIELAVFSDFSESEITLLNSVANNIGIAVNAAESRDKVMELLEQVQLQKIDLQNQQEELRQTNEELTRQAEVLQASEEELRVQEEELRQINAELEEKNEAVEMSRQALSQKAKELEITGKYKSEFLANMSHELRTPLNSVLILAKILSENKQDNLTGKQVEYANIIHKSGTDLLNLINDILDLSKIEAGKIDFNFEDVAVSEVVKDIEQMFYVVAEEKAVKFETERYADVPGNVFTDKNRLEQVIKNLLSNAFKFTPRDGKVTLAFKMSERNDFYEKALKDRTNILEISVTDTGIGIPAEKQQLIFEAFQQADGSTSRKYGGTGLGLSISKELVKKLGGEIRLFSKENEGSTFSIYLPVDTESVPQHVQPVDDGSVVLPAIDLSNVTEQGKVSDDRAQLHAGDKVILIIEDDPQFARIVQDFARSKKYKTVVALQGDEGLYYARKYKPSAIILDIQLPVIDGWTLLKILKSDATLRDIPVHIVTATDVDKSGGAALAFLKKPLEKDDLENAFELIGKNIQSDIKKLLVLSHTNAINNFIELIVKQKHTNLQYVHVTSEQEALQKLQEETYDCIIVDIGNKLDEGKLELEHISNAVKKDSIPVILYLDDDISTSDELHLKKFSNVIIRNSQQANDRLLDEMELFLYKVQENKNSFLPRTSKDAIEEKNLKGRKVLLVDDDMRNVFALTNLLEEQDMDILTAGDGKEALDVLDKNPGIEIVLMDVMMPEMDGYEATRRIRQDKRFTQLPVIALTAKAMQGDRDKVIEAGASDYITKPVDSSRLFSLMRVWLAK